MNNLSFTIYCLPTIFLLSFLLNAEDSIGCFPPCRAGYTCHEGNCISICNPPCPYGQKCTNEGECVEINRSFNFLTESPPIPNKSVRSIACDNIFIVRPDLSPSIIPGDFDDGELLNASNLVANTIMSKVNSSSTIISFGELESVRGCKSKLIVCKIKSYYKEPSRLGQYKGIVTILIESYNSTNDNSPISIEEFSAKGEIHWGDSVPLENAFKAVSKKIERDFEQ